MTTLKSTIELSTLIGIAKQYRKGDEFVNSGFKPYWAPKNGVKAKHFFAFVESFGYSGSVVLPYLTRNGYFDAHVRTANVPVATIAAKPVVSNAKPVVTPKAPRLVKAAKAKALSINDFEMADVLKLVKAGQLRFKA